jgi:hypothetical protein
MPESKLFMSSCSRRQLARRRPGRAGRVQLLLAMLMILICAAAFLTGRGVL